MGREGQNEAGQKRRKRGAEAPRFRRQRSDGSGRAPYHLRPLTKIQAMAIGASRRQAQTQAASRGKAIAP